MPTRALVTSHEQDLALYPDAWHRMAMVLGGAVALGWPFLASSHWVTVGNAALVAVVGALALMVLTGFCGQVSLGHAAFLALGAYTAAVLGRTLGLPFWLLLPASGVVAAVTGLAVGVFALRLKGLYLAIVTLGMVLLVQHVLLALPELTGGQSGTMVPMHLWFAGEGRAASFRDTWVVGGVVLPFERKLHFLYLLLALGTAALVRNLQRSHTGRAMMAVRDQDLAASAMGVNPTHAKILAFGVSSFLAGVAGAMFAFQQQYITVEPPFDLGMSIHYVAMIVLGGVGTVFGAVAGALAFTFLTPLAEGVGRALPLLDRLSSAQQSTVLFAAAVLALLAFEPLGLFGLWLRVKRYFAAWPFSY
jgi:branched-chain amino acid transport system permease protein